VDRNTDVANSDRNSSQSLKAEDVALCFKVPFRFRQWFKLQALNRNLTMTEFLVQAAEWYSQAHLEIGTRSANVTDLRK
jgi:hypothetical protein